MSQENFVTQNNAIFFSCDLLQRYCAWHRTTEEDHKCGQKCYLIIVYSIEIAYFIVVIHLAICYVYILSLYFRKSPASRVCSELANVRLTYSMKNICTAN